MLVTALAGGKTESVGRGSDLVAESAPAFVF